MRLFRFGHHIAEMVIQPGIIPVELPKQCFQSTALEVPLELFQTEIPFRQYGFQTEIASRTCLSVKAITFGNKNSSSFMELISFDYKKLAINSFITHYFSVKFLRQTRWSVTFVYQNFFPLKNLKTVLGINVTKNKNVIKAKRTGLVFRK